MILGSELAGIVQSRYGFIDYEWGIKDASTDFGRISYGAHPIDCSSVVVC